MTESQTAKPRSSASPDVDVVVIGAGFAGLYMVYKLREIGLSVRGIDRASDVGGTWYWNRYPGARCDVESIEYSYSFSDEVQQTWSWSERYAAQPEILRYIEFVAEKYELRKYFSFSTAVTSAIFDEASSVWRVTTNHDELVICRFCVLATGLLSAPKTLNFENVDQYDGEIYQTSMWPHAEVDLSGKSVGVIGTGSSAIQCIPEIAQSVKALTVFQRTANFSMPLNNGPMPRDFEQDVKAHYAEWRERERNSRLGMCAVNGRLSKEIEVCSGEVTAAERNSEFERHWQSGGLSIYSSYPDLMTDKSANDQIAAFWKSKISGKVADPDVARLLSPSTHPFGTKRLCADTGYFETYNRNNVTLVDISNNPISSFGSKGLCLADGSPYSLDAVVFATGFDSISGSIMNIDIRGRNGRSIQSHWGNGPRTYLGRMVAGYPNMFIINGPHSPFGNNITNIEIAVEWITETLEYLGNRNCKVIEAEVAAENNWVTLCSEVASQTLFRDVNTWVMGAEIPGKPRAVLLYLGGVARYRAEVQRATQGGYAGFRIL